MSQRRKQFILENILNLCVTAKALLRGTFIAQHAYFRKEGGSEINVCKLPTQYNRKRMANYIQRA